MIKLALLVWKNCKVEPVPATGINQEQDEPQAQEERCYENVNQPLSLAPLWLHSKITYRGNMVSEMEVIIHGSNSMGSFPPKMLQLLPFLMAKLTVKEMLLCGYSALKYLRCTELSSIKISLILSWSQALPSFPRALLSHSLLFPSFQLPLPSFFLCFLPFFLVHFSLYLYFQLSYPFYKTHIFGSWEQVLQSLFTLVVYFVFQSC